MIFTSPQILFPHYSFKSYRIEVDMTQPRLPLQRHIWTMSDGSIQEDEWFNSLSQTEEDLIKRGFAKKDKI